ncbi:hypothetical protein BKA69DRAFT_296568 [Paraphysoderma sedebokerense]|nr:hypothetical protein BKA69DRAFT_296568 [Paraphysoderma sedebokerense]
MDSLSALSFAQSGFSTIPDTPRPRSLASCTAIPNNLCAEQNAANSLANFCGVSKLCAQSVGPAPAPNNSKCIQCFKILRRKPCSIKFYALGPIAPSSPESPASTEEPARTGTSPNYTLILVIAWTIAAVVVIAFFLFRLRSRRLRNKKVEHDSDRSMSFHIEGSSNSEAKDDRIQSMYNHGVNGQEFINERGFNDNHDDGLHSEDDLDGFSDYTNDTHSVSDRHNALSISSSGAPAFSASSPSSQDTAYLSERRFSVQSIASHMSFPDPSSAFGNMESVPTPASLSRKREKESRNASPSLNFNKKPTGIRVTLGFIPEREDEMPLDAGDKVVVYELFDDGWARGANLTKHISDGMFPVACINSANTVTPDNATDSSVSVRDHPRRSSLQSDTPVSSPLNDERAFKNSSSSNGVSDQLKREYRNRYSGASQLTVDYPTPVGQRIQESEHLKTSPKAKSKQVSEHGASNNTEYQTHNVSESDKQDYRRRFSNASELTIEYPVPLNQVQRMCGATADSAAQVQQRSKGGKTKSSGQSKSRSLKVPGNAGQSSQFPEASEEQKREYQRRYSTASELTLDYPVKLNEILHGGVPETIEEESEVESDIEDVLHTNSSVNARSQSAFTSGPQFQFPEATEAEKQEYQRRYSTSSELTVAYPLQVSQLQRIETPQQPVISADKSPFRKKKSPKNTKSTPRSARSTTAIPASSALSYPDVSDSMKQDYSRRFSNASELTLDYPINLNEIGRVEVEAPAELEVESEEEEVELVAETPKPRSKAMKAKSQRSRPSIQASQVVMKLPEASAAEKSEYQRRFSTDSDLTIDYPIHLNQIARVEVVPQVELEIESEEEEIKIIQEVPKLKPKTKKSKSSPKARSTPQSAEVVIQFPEASAAEQAEYRRRFSTDSDMTVDYPIHLNQIKRVEVAPQVEIDIESEEDEVEIVAETPKPKPKQRKAKSIPKTRALSRSAEVVIQFPEASPSEQAEYRRRFSTDSDMTIDYPIHLNQIKRVEIAPEVEIDIESEEEIIEIVLATPKPKSKPKSKSAHKPSAVPQPVEVVIQFPEASASEQSEYQRRFSNASELTLDFPVHLSQVKRIEIAPQVEVGVGSEEEEVEIVKEAPKPKSEPKKTKSATKPHAAPQPSEIVVQLPEASAADQAEYQRRFSNASELTVDHPIVLNQIKRVEVFPEIEIEVESEEEEVELVEEAPKPVAKVKKTKPTPKPRAAPQPAEIVVQLPEASASEQAEYQRRFSTASELTVNHPIHLNLIKRVEIAPQVDFEVESEDEVEEEEVEIVSPAPQVLPRPVPQIDERQSVTQASNVTTQSFAPKEVSPQPKQLIVQLPTASKSEREEYAKRYSNVSVLTLDYPIPLNQIQRIEVPTSVDSPSKSTPHVRFSTVEIIPSARSSPKTTKNPKLLEVPVANKSPLKNDKERISNKKKQKNIALKSPAPSYHSQSKSKNRKITPAPMPAELAKHEFSSVSSSKSVSRLRSSNKVLPQTPSQSSNTHPLSNKNIRVTSADFTNRSSVSLMVYNPITDTIHPDTTFTSPDPATSYGVSVSQHNITSPASPPFSPVAESFVSNISFHSAISRMSQDVGVEIEGGEVESQRSNDWDIDPVVLFDFQERLEAKYNYV